MKALIQKAAAAIFLMAVFCTNAKAFTAVASGNWSSAATWGGTAPGAAVSGQDIVIPSSIHVVLDMDVTYSATINSFTVNGTLDNTSTNSLTLIQGELAGSGTIGVARLAFQTLATTSFSGIMTVKNLVNSGATLILASVANVADTLNLDAGSLLLNTGANLSLLANSTIRINGGTITIGGGIFNTSNNYNVLYAGSSKTTGIELNSATVQQCYVQLTDNAQTLTLNTNLMINGDLMMTTGIFNISGKMLTLHGDVKTTAGSVFTSNATSSMVFTGPASLSSGLVFSAGSSLLNLTVTQMNNGVVKLTSPLSISGRLNLMSGTFDVATGGMLTQSTGSLIHVESGLLTATGGTFAGASYDVEYMGGAAVTGVELTGAGIRNLTIALVNGTQAVKLAKSVTVAGTLALVTGKLDLNGDTVTANGTFHQMASATLIGSTSSSLVMNLTTVTNDTLYFDGSNQNLKWLKVNKTNGGNLVLGTALVINNELDLIKGKIALVNNDLQILSAAVISGYDSAKYVVTTGMGRLQMGVNSGSSFTTFPIGTLSSYSPASIQQTATGTTGYFMIRVTPGVWTDGVSGFNSATIASVVDRTWMIDAESTMTINMNMKLAWVAAAEVNGFDRTHAYISHYKNAMWDTTAVTAASSGVNNVYELTRNAITSLSPFAVADKLAPLGVKENFDNASVNMYPNPSSDFVNIQISTPGTETSTYLYEVFDATGRAVLSTSNNNQLNSFQVAGFVSGCYFIKITNLSTHAVMTKRFMKS